MKKRSGGGGGGGGGGYKCGVKSGCSNILKYKVFLIPTFVAQVMYQLLSCAKG